MQPQKQEEVPLTQLIRPEIGKRKSVTFTPRTPNTLDELATFRLSACGLPQALCIPLLLSAEIK